MSIKDLLRRNSRYNSLLISPPRLSHHARNKIGHQIHFFQRSFAPQRQPDQRIGGRIRSAQSFNNMRRRHRTTRTGRTTRSTDSFKIQSTQKSNAVRVFNDKGNGVLQTPIWVTIANEGGTLEGCLLYTSPSPRDATLSRMPSSA